MGKGLLFCFRMGRLKLREVAELRSDPCLSHSEVCVLTRRLPCARNLSPERFAGNLTFTRGGLSDISSAVASWPGAQMARMDDG